MKVGYVIRDLMSVPSGVGEGNAITIEYDNSRKPLGLPTGSWTRVLETVSQKQGVKNYTLYDQKARPARVATLYPDNGKTITDTEFNFIGDPKYTLTTHKKNALADELKIKETYTYTAQGRLNFVRHQINNESSRILTQNSYDELGRLLRKKVGGTSVLSSDELQIVDYKYNIRGWLTDINNVNNLNQPGGGPVDLFAFKINYNTFSTNASLGDKNFATKVHSKFPNASLRIFYKGNYTRYNSNGSLKPVGTFLQMRPAQKLFKGL